MRVLCFSESSSLSAESMVLLLNDWAHVSRKFTQGEYAKCLHNRKENDSKIKVRAPSERCAAHPVAAQLAVKFGWVRLLLITGEKAEVEALFRSLRSSMVGRFFVVRSAFHGA